MSKYTTKPSFGMELHLAAYDVDRNQRMRVCAMLRHQQQLGDLHLLDAGLSYNTMCELGFVFVAASVRGVIFRAPTLNERITLTTWCRTEKSRFLRCFEYTDDAGVRVASAVCVCAAVDASTHRILRPSVFTDICDCEDPDRPFTSPPPEKIIPVGEAADAGTRRILFSDIDCNGHINNAVYGDFATDFLTQEQQLRPVREYGIAFEREARQGDVLDISRVEGDGKIYTVGTNAGERCFRAYVVLG